MNNTDFLVACQLYVGYMLLACYQHGAKKMGKTELRNIEEVAKELELAPTTIRKWDKDFNLNLKRNSKNNRIFADEDIIILKGIKELKDNGSGLNTITRKLNLHVTDIQPEKVEQKEIELNNNLKEHVNDMEVYVNDMSVKIDKLSGKLEGVLELSEKYSRACYEVGTLKAQLEAEKEKNKLISESGNKDLTWLKKDMEKNLSDKEKEIEALKMENEKLKNKKWWQRIFSP